MTDLHDCSLPPAGDVYLRFLDLVSMDATFIDFYSGFDSEQYDCHPVYRRILDQLLSSAGPVELVPETPGTVSGGGSPYRRTRVPCTPGNLELLRSLPMSMYSYIGPWLPEDMTFVSGDKVLSHCIAHERIWALTSELNAALTSEFDETRTPEFTLMITESVCEIHTTVYGAFWLSSRLPSVPGQSLYVACAANSTPPLRGLRLSGYPADDYHCALDASGAEYLIFLSPESADQFAYHLSQELAEQMCTRIEPQITILPEDFVTGFPPDRVRIVVHVSPAMKSA